MRLPHPEFDRSRGKLGPIHLQLGLSDGARQPREYGTQAAREQLGAAERM
ncbi:MAG: hypothetical protein IPO40_05610 [Fibrobacteres bacterium]|nr:hypothetical protein [Fibrobacterota bacterium]